MTDEAWLIQNSLVTITTYNYNVLVQITWYLYNEKQNTNKSKWRCWSDLATCVISCRLVMFSIIKQLFTLSALSPMKEQQQNQKVTVSSYLMKQFCVCVLCIFLLLSFFVLRFRCTYIIPTPSLHLFYTLRAPFVYLSYTFPTHLQHLSYTFATPFLHLTWYSSNPLVVSKTSGHHARNMPSYPWSRKRV